MLCCVTLNEVCRSYASDILVLFQIKKGLPYCRLSEVQCILFSVYDRHSFLKL
jgi:hypothetical protein